MNEEKFNYLNSLAQDINYKMNHINQDVYVAYQNEDLDLIMTAEDITGNKRPILLMFCGYWQANGRDYLDFPKGLNELSSDTIKQIIDDNIFGKFYELAIKQFKKKKVTTKELPNDFKI